MFRKRFFASWIFASIGMFMLSYFWHSVILSDFSILIYPIRLFMLIAAFVYLLLGYFVAKSFSIPFLATKYKRKPFSRGIAGGTVCGLSFYIISTILGISFTTTITVKHLLYDSLWQVIEQGIGGVIVAITHIFIYEPEIVED